MYLRRPELLNNPQFWAEDGAIWYQVAYNEGAFSSIIQPVAGYFQTISKLMGAITLNVDLAYAPLIYNVSALAIRAGLVAFFLSRRFSSVPLLYRIAISTFVVLMPDLEEIHANVTNDQWYLSLYLLLVVLAPHGRSLFSKIHDIVSIIICGLSGPFIIFMMPVVVIKAYLDFKRGDHLNKLIISSLIIVCLIQGGSLLMTISDARFSPELGFSILLLFKLLSTRIFLAILTTPVWSAFLWEHSFFCVIFGILCLGVLVFTFIRAKSMLKYAIIFGVVMIAAALKKPMVPNDVLAWPCLQIAAGRYFVVPTVIWFATVVWFFNRIFSKYSSRIVIAITMCVFACDVVFFKLPRLEDFHWADQVAEFNNLPVGEKYTFKFNPVGWTMTLDKR